MGDNTTQQQDDAREQLGKPVSGFKTGLTKVVSGLGLAVAAVSVAIGAFALVTGRGSSLTPKMAQMAEHFSPRAAGAGQLVGGLVGGTIAKAQWDSASSASRTRNYINLKNQLDEQSVSKNQGRG
jgi:hypothetical protein